MYIIKFQGGLGNQMFQYALYLKLKEQGHIVKADIGSYYQHNNSTPRNFCINRLFGADISIASEAEIRKLYATESEKIKRAIIKRVGKKSYYKENAKSLDYKKEIFDLKEAYLEGFWQSEKYFEDIKETVSNAYYLPRFAFDRHNTVAVHVRMGDYTQPEYAQIYGNICNKNYYSKAMDYMRSRLDHPTFVVFSDEIGKAKAVIGVGEDIIYNTSQYKISEIEDMARMSECEHQIIANSSYSWWAAWLNDNCQKIVVTPSKWLNGIDKDDVVPKEWIRI